jgi:gamma-glutamyltranspeptidase/glutathione hydrolase
MRRRRNFQRCLLVIASILTLIGIIVFDTIKSGSSSYLYAIGSWVICEISSDICKNPSSTVSGKKGIVVTTQHEASQVGLQILSQGGNAVDAAVAIGYALAVTDPCCGNLGGGGFMLIRQAEGKNIFINFREKAPLAANANMYLDENGNVIRGLSTKGYLAVGVPGTVKGLDYALSQYGTLSRQQVMNPAIALAEKGFILKKGDVQILRENRDKFNDSNVAAIFLKDGKNSYQVGDRKIQKDLAQTLKLIATKGTEAFYQGEIAQKIVKASQEHNGILSLKDLASYEVREQDPIRCNYRGYEVRSAPPPGGGTTVCQMLNILEGYDLKKLGFRSSESLHLFLSAMLYAYSDRNTYLGDPEFIKLPLEMLLSKQYAARIRSQIPSERAISPARLFSNSSEEGTNTTHYSVIDKYGNAVAVTYTINTYFGAGVIAGDTGFFLNNEMDDFTSKPGLPNQFGLVQGKNNIIEPGKRPLSSMSPTIITKDGQVVLVTGSPGGPTILTTILQVITNVIDYEMTLNEAVSTPRIHYQGLPNFVLTEPYALNSQILKELRQKGYKTFPFKYWGAAESIGINPNSKEFDGVNDKRKSAGKAVAF